MEPETPQPAPATETKTSENSAARIGIYIAVGATVLLIIVLLWMLNSARVKGEDMAASANKAGMVRSAEAFGAAVLPLLDMKNKGMLTDDSEMQRVVEGVVQQGNFELAVVTDTRGNVVASSDTKFNGQQYSGLTPATGHEKKVDGAWEIARPVKRADVVYGAVVLRGK